MEKEEQAINFKISFKEQDISINSINIEYE